MPQEDVPEQLIDTRVDEMPKSTPYRLTQPVLVDNEMIVKPGEALVSLDTRRLPLQIRMLLAHIPDNAYHVMRARNIVSIILMGDSIPSAEGVAFASGDARITAGRKRDVAPSLVTGELLELRTAPVAELPKEQPMILADDYQCVSSNGVMFLSPVPLEHKDLVLDITSPLIDGLFVRKGQTITLREKDEKLVFETWDNRKFQINPKSRLSVYIPT